MPAVRVLVIANPRATATSDRQRDVLTHALASDADLQIAETANRGHAAALACRAMRDGTDVVVALGGDGTVNEVVNGLLTDGVHPRVPALGVVPAGSTNVFTRALGLPNDAVEATGALLEALRAGSTPAGELGPGRRQVVHLRRRSRLRRRRRRRGRAAPPHAAPARRTRSTCGSGSGASSQRTGVIPALHVQLADGTAVDNVFFAVVANADPWTFAGTPPLRPTPDVTFDGGLGVYARRRMSAAGVLFSMARLVGQPAADRAAWGALSPTTWTRSLSGRTSRCRSRSTASTSASGTRCPSALSAGAIRVVM